MELLLGLVVGLLIGLAVGAALVAARSAREAGRRQVAVDAELQAARQRAERADGETQALRMRLAAADAIAEHPLNPAPTIGAVAQTSGREVAGSMATPDAVAPAVGARPARRTRRVDPMPDPAGAGIDPMGPAAPEQPSPLPALPEEALLVPARTEPPMPAPLLATPAPVPVAAAQPAPPAAARPPRTRPRPVPAPDATPPALAPAPAPAEPPVEVRVDVTPPAPVPAPASEAPVDEPVAEPAADVSPTGWRPVRPGLSDPHAWLGTLAPDGTPYAEDDLERIHGVGPYLARRLRDEGILTYRQIAEWDEDDMTLVSRRIGSFPDRIRREDWPASARELHAEVYGETLT